ncbi:hypothetical protein P153DRAFT_370823 [Dothidotthia symphoricarpi CBS 119687]|uniref:Uncharacterized protein n=1 Tax=Dothidotthia symphoricarpi CBS 119687 TaxID=1392245 RepID=A0A6A5ZZQ1_9PLEO|nr:uncharacterized protein P153DRAFT_370823 [Dothidotthia symphoricarpi CBS 119687]KAF2124373.1 hypothetical protein P153DRAFT_370823 [Dothidotthia symphoricarpi CBS 119687]
MTSVQEKIQHISGQHAQLLQGLQETESSPSQLQQQTAYLTELNAQIARTHKRVQDLTRITNKELEDHKKYSESRYRRFAHKASGRKARFAEKAAKEEREYFDAIQSQRTAEDELEYTKELKAETEIQVGKLETSAQRYTILKTELDNLYNNIFDGPTPELPEEDAKENTCIAASQHVQTLNQALERERHILFLLRQASTKLAEARNHMESAYDASCLDMFGGSSHTSTQKRNYLERAESSIQQVRMLQQQLCHLAPELPTLGDMNIASGSIWGDVYFDNIFSDMDMHDRIKASEVQIDKARNLCGNLVQDGVGREATLKAKLGKGEKKLKEARLDLQGTREDAMRRVLESGQYSAMNDATPACSG